MRNLFKSKFVATAAVAMAVAVLGVVGIRTGVGASYVKDCDANAMLWCGAPDAKTLINSVQTGGPKKQTDLKAVYTYTGLGPDRYERFIKTAVPGTVYKDGRIVVDGQVVGTRSYTMGRNPRSHQYQVSVGNKTYYASSTQYSLASSSLPAMVMFGSNGEPQFIALNACGNPVFTTTVIPKYSCNMLRANPVSGQANTYDFTASYTATNNAVYTKAVYDFGDGTSATSTEANGAIRHTYAKPGDYTAKVTVYVKLPGRQVAPATSVNCQTRVTVARPFQMCVELNSKVINVKDRSFEFMVTTKQGNGSALKNASFDFGDGTTAANVTPSSDTTVTTDHTYAKAGTYTVDATVAFTTPYGDQTANCSTSVTISEEVCPLKPSVPKNSPECQPCEYNPNIPVGSKACVPPTPKPKPTPKTVMPTTGAGDVIGLFGSATVAGGLGYRLINRRRG